MCSVCSEELFSVELSSEELLSEELSSEELLSEELSSEELLPEELSSVGLEEELDVELDDGPMMDGRYSSSNSHDAAPSETAATVSTLRTVSKTFLAFFIKKSPFYLCFDYIIRRRICQ